MGIEHEQLEMALRKNRGDQIRADWLKRLSKACGADIISNDLLNIKETEDLKKKFYDRVKNGLQKSCVEWSKESFVEAILYLDKILSSNDLMEVVLFSSVDRYIGAVKLSLKYLLNNIEKIWSVVEEDLSVTSVDLEHGFCLELNFYGCNGIYAKDGIYQLTAWGVFQDHSSADIQ